MRPSLALASALCAALAVPASATPYAGQYDYAGTGQVTVTGADGRPWVLTVQMTEGGDLESREERQLYVTLQHCQANYCAVVGRWTKPLPSSEVSIDAAVAPGVGSTSRARVRTTLAGRPLQVDLSGDHVTGTSWSGFVPTTSPVGVRPELDNYSFAGGTIALGGLRCTIGDDDGVIGQATGADTVGIDGRTVRTPPPASLPAGFLAGKRAARC